MALPCPAPQDPTASSRPPSLSGTRGEVTSGGCCAPPEVGGGPGSGARPLQPCSARPGGASRGHGAGREQIKPWSELSFPVKIYFCVTILSLLSVIGLTIETLVRQRDEDFTISLIQLIGVVFCVYYVTRGILQENRQELIVFVLSIVLVMFRSIVNFMVLADEQKPKLLARFILILLVGAFDVICAIILIQSQSMMAFRVGGALESLQSQYFMLNLCFSMLTFDLQAQLCLCVLLLTSLHEITLAHSIILATGVLWACLKVTIGIIAVIREWGLGSSYALEAAVITGSCISLAIKSVLFWALFHVYHSFGQGLRERMFSSYGRIDS
ncbi:PREDICTED: uncharacterized protein LOC109314259 isoform X2 [Crocodylus porosus]|uniref:uncharacterized protein LOC109314259 isoform X2 n=1 Tax=Crocodylus porosus TaxID=8502 RepID=UPI00093A75AF|nr:PREDICTED: uncharacterized protein LOC109314259 isoform X2 [Crocodylus porosus]